MKTTLEIGTTGFWNGNFIIEDILDMEKENVLKQTGLHHMIQMFDKDTFSMMERVEAPLDSCEGIKIEFKYQKNALAVLKKIRKMVKEDGSMNLIVSECNDYIECVLFTDEDDSPLERGEYMGDGEYWMSW